MRLGEKPFRCNVCKNRFTHANRKCPSHPLAGLRRDESAEKREPLRQIDYQSLSSINVTMLGSRSDELMGALALIELSKCC